MVHIIRKSTVLIILLCFWRSNLLIGQFRFIGKMIPGLKITCSIPKVVRSNKDLDFKIIVNNVSDSSIEIYSELFEAITPFEFPNFNILIEKKDGKIFKEYQRGAFIDRMPTFNESDSIDTKKKNRLSSGDSISYHFHLDDLYQFDTLGTYRIKLFYKNNVMKDDYINSSWVYFSIITKLYVKHYYKEN